MHTAHTHTTGRHRYCNRVLRLLGALAGMAIASSSLAAATGTPYTLNTNTTGSQALIATAAAGNGDKIVVWEDATLNRAAFLQVIDSQGNRRFSSDLFVGYNVVDVAADRVGNFIVTNNETDGDGRGVFAKAYDRNGNTRINTFRVNNSIYSEQYGATVAIGSDGKFAIGWSQRNGSVMELYYKEYTAAGQAITAPILISTGSVNQLLDDIVIQNNGTVAISYSAVFNNNFDAWLKRYNSTGSLLGSPVMLNTYQVNSQVSSKLASDSFNRLMAVWDSFGQDGTGWSSYGQLLNASGSKIGGEFRINASLSLYQPGIQIAATNDGNFATTWHFDSNNGVYVTEVHAREFNAAGTAVTPDTVIIGNSGGDVTFPQILMDPAGNYLLSWRRYNAATNYDVIAQPFRISTQPAITLLGNNTTVNNLQAATGEWRYFKIVTPPGTSALYLNLTGGGVGNADMYLLYGALPSLTSYDVISAGATSSEYMGIGNPPPGDMYIAVYAKEGYSGAALNIYYY